MSLTLLHAHATSFFLLGHLGQYEGLCPVLTTACCYEVFSYYYHEACSFMKRKGGSVDLGERRGEDRTERHGGREGCSGDE